MTFLLGQHKVARHGHLRIWAERGLVHIEDERDNSYEIVSVRDMLLRLNALNEFKPGIDGTESPLIKAWVYENRADLQRAVEDVLAVCKQAQEQGMPTDPTASRALRAARPVSVAVKCEVDLSYLD